MTAALPRVRRTAILLTCLAMAACAPEPPARRFDFPDQTSPRSSAPGMARQGTAQSVEIGPIDQRMLRAVNEVRRANGLAALTIDPRLSLAAAGHSRDMLVNDFFSHDGADGAKLGERVDRAGYRWMSVRENISAGHDNPEDAVDDWMRSEGHRNNMLASDVVHLGVGHIFDPSDGGRAAYGHYWTLVLAAPQ